MDSGYLTVIFIDFAKAFDKVPHNLLLLKLASLKLDPPVLQWTTSFLNNRSQFVYANDVSSPVSPVTSGVPQGTVLGPLLFLIFINDLPQAVSSSIRLFADDCVIYRKITDPADVLALQNDLDYITTWCTTWQMSLNTNKCKHMRFSRSVYSSIPNYYLGGSLLQHTESYKYLGVHLTSNLSWSTHINFTVRSANRKLGYIRRNFRETTVSLKKPFTLHSYVPLSNTHLVSGAHIRTLLSKLLNHFKTVPFGASHLIILALPVSVPWRHPSLFLIFPFVVKYLVWVFFRKFITVTPTSEILYYQPHHTPLHVLTTPLKSAAQLVRPPVPSLIAACRYKRLEPPATFDCKHCWYKNV